MSMYGHNNKVVSYPRCILEDMVAGATPLASSLRLIIAITMVNLHKAKMVYPGPKQGTSPSSWVLNLYKYIVYHI